MPRLNRSTFWGRKQSMNVRHWKTQVVDIRSLNYFYVNTTLTSYLVVGGFGVSLDLWTDVEGSADHACHVTWRIVMPKAKHSVREEHSYQTKRNVNAYQTLFTCWVRFEHHCWAALLHLKCACSLREIHHLHELITFLSLEFYILY